jgi:G:T-mismatch repair DNA endonuclease (very short patch repair protein)
MAGTLNTNTIYQYQGCFFYGHQCHTTAKIKDQRCIEERGKKLKKTLEISAFLQEKGYNIIEMWE